jgi:LEA14-like dessication related protein
MKKLLPFLVLIFVVFYTSCKKPEAFTYRDLKNFRVSNFGLDKSRVSMDLVFFNPNYYGVDLKKVDSDIYIDSTFAGKFLLDTTIHIAKNAEFTIPASFDVDMKTIFKNTLNLLISNEVLVGARGTTRVGKGGIFVTIPFQYEGKQKLNLF